MNSERVCFVDANKEYMNAIERYIINNCGQINVTFISSAAKLLGVLEDRESKSYILLISENMYTEELQKYGLQKIVLLTENVIDDKGSLPTIYKYQSGEKLLAEIVSLFDDGSNKRKFNRMSESTKVVGIYSPIGGAGKTTVAVILSMLAAYREKRVLYLNLEDIPSTSNYFKGTEGGDLSKMIYYLRKKRKTVQDSILKIQQLDSKHNVYFFAPADNVDDLSSMSIDEYTLLLESICKTEQFDYVFIDFSTELSAKKKAMLNACDKVLLILSGDENCSVKVEIFEKEIEHSAVGNSAKEKMVVILNKHLVEYTMNIEKTTVCGKGIEYRIPYDKSLKYRLGTEYVLDNNNDMQEAINEIFLELR